MNDTIPAHAEQIDFMTVFTTRREPSRFVPGLEALVPYLVCPGCKTEYADRPTALTTFRCDCGLSMQSAATGFFIWRTLAQQAAE